MRALLKQVAEAGLSPRWLLARHALAGPRSSGDGVAATPASILFSFPYHSVGDVVLAVPLLEKLHSLWPAAVIDVLIGETMAGLIGSLPFVRRVVVVPRSRSGRPIQLAYGQLRQIRRSLSHRTDAASYDLSIAPRWEPADSLFSAYGAYLSGAPVRCGYVGVNGQPQTPNPLLTRIARGGVHEHEADRYLRLLERCGLSSGNTEVSISTRPVQSLSDLAAARRRTGNSALPVSPPFFLLAPGATSPMRMWPLQSFSEAARALRHDFQWTPVILGAPSDKALCDELASRIGSGARSLAGTTSPLQMLDLMAASTLLIGNDSGPAHLSGALNRPTFVLSPFPLSCRQDHHNNPERFHPVGEHTHVFQPATPSQGCVGTCSSASAHCILQISPAILINAVRETVAYEGVAPLCG